MIRFPWPLGPIAHRGLHDNARGIIENTLSAVRAARQRSYAIEVDLQPAQGGVPVVFHDETLDRLCDGTGETTQFTVEELADIPIHGTTDRIFPLASLLEEIDGAVPLVIEVKSDRERNLPFERDIADQINAYRGPCALMSFVPGTVRALKATCPARPVGLLSYDYRDAETVAKTSAWERLMLRNMVPALTIRPDFVAYDIQSLPTTGTRMARMLGRPVLTWTVRTPEERTRAAKFADAMIFEHFEP